MFSLNSYTNNIKKMNSNSISECLNGLMDNLKKKKNNHDRDFKLNISLNSTNLKNESIDKINETNKGLTLEKIVQKQNFDKKYSRIMRALSPKNSDSNTHRIKNINLWDLKMKNNSNLDRDHSLKRLEDFKIRLVYDQEQEKEKFDEQKLFLKTIKRSSSSDFFKSTTNSDNKTFSSSKNSFHPINNMTSNFNSFIKAEQNFSDRNANMSFNSFKSVSSNNLKKNNISENDLNLSPKSNKGFEKTKRVNFDDFNNIGENPFKINLYDKNSMLTNSRKIYKKYGNMKEGYNLSPKNIYSPINNTNNNISKKKNNKYEDICFINPKIFSNSNTNYLNANSNLNKSESSNEYMNSMNSKRFSMKRIDNLLKNFTQNTNTSYLNSKNNANCNSPKGKNANNSQSFMIVKEKNRKLNNLLK